MAWTKPTSFTDSDSKWNAEEQAYDDNTGTGADSPNNTAKTWGSYIELNIASLSCDKIRFNALYNVANINEISVDVYYLGSWHNIFEGSYVNQTWTEKAIGTTEDVTAARVKFYAKKAATAYLYELEFNEILPANEYYQNVSGGLTFTGLMIKSSLLTLMGSIGFLSSINRLAKKKLFSNLTFTGNLFKLSKKMLFGILSINGSFGKGRKYYISIGTEPTIWDRKM